MQIPIVIYFCIAKMIANIFYMLYLYVTKAHRANYKISPEMAYPLLLKMLNKFGSNPRSKFYAKNNIDSFVYNPLNTKRRNQMNRLQYSNSGVQTKENSNTLTVIGCLHFAKSLFAILFFVLLSIG